MTARTAFSVVDDVREGSLSESFLISWIEVEPETPLYEVGSPRTGV